MWWTIYNLRTPGLKRLCWSTFHTVQFHCFWNRLEVVQFTFSVKQWQFQWTVCVCVCTAPQGLSNKGSMKSELFLFRIQAVLTHHISLCVSPVLRWNLPTLLCLKCLFFFPDFLSSTYKKHCGDTYHDIFIYTIKLNDWQIIVTCTLI